MLPVVLPSLSFLLLVKLPAGLGGQVGGQWSFLLLQTLWWGYTGDYLLMGEMVKAVGAVVVVGLVEAFYFLRVAALRFLVHCARLEVMVVKAGVVGRVAVGVVGAAALPASHSQSAWVKGVGLFHPAAVVGGTRCRVAVAAAAAAIMVPLLCRRLKH